MPALFAIVLLIGFVVFITVKAIINTERNKKLYHDWYGGKCQHPRRPSQP